MLALTSTACSDDGNAGQSGTEGEDETGTTGASDATASATSTSTASGSATSTSGGSDTGMDTNGFIGPDTTTGPAEPGPDGAMCGSNEECQSGFCYTVPQLGGVCSECLQDSDCEMGTCSLDINAGYAVCTDGGLGNMCDSDEGCMGDLVCSELIDTGGIFPANFCSECGDSAPCSDGQICSPSIDAGSFSGYMTCVDPMSVPNGEACPVENGMGDGSVCISGICGVADLMGFVQIGVCSECATDQDCTGMQTCTPASVSQGGLMAGTCG